MSRICQKCKTESDELITLRMNCFYDMNELGIPFEYEIFYETSDPREDGLKFFTIDVCKDCRSCWMKAIDAWFHTILFDHPPCGSGIFVRKYGANIEITEQQWKELNPDREPVRFKKEG